MTEKLSIPSHEKQAPAEIEPEKVHEQRTAETLPTDKSLERDDSSTKEALADAVDLATKNEKTRHSPDQSESPAQRRRGAPSKAQREKAFNATINEVQSHMTTSERVTSKIIHAKGIEKTSDVLGSTILRPNAMLAGSISAFICVTAFYFIAKNYGYQLSGFETIGAFVVGWIMGILYDYVRVMIRGHR